MPSLRLPALVGLVALAALACSSSEQPGWTYAPPPSATPIPSTAASPGASGAPSAAPSGASAAPSGAPEGQTIELSAQNVKFDKATILAPAGQKFYIKFTNNDSGVLHNVAIKDANGAMVFEGDIFAGVDSRTYEVPPLPPGSYQFVCTVHPNMVGTLTAG